MNAPGPREDFEEGISNGKREESLESLEGGRNHVGVSLLLLLHQLLTGNLERDSEADLGRLLL
jgi:hypothetical protein